MEVKWESYKGKSILIVDYTGILMETRMIAHMNSALPQLQTIKEGEQLLLLSDLTGCYVTPGYLEAVKKIEKEIMSKYQLKSAILGIHGAKAILLKSYNLIAKSKVQPFNTRKEALEFLCRDK